MGKERERNRVKSRVDELPEIARKLLDARLDDVTNTYQEISDEMANRGWAISKSAIGRYALRRNAVAKRLKDAREQTIALINSVRDNQDIEATEVASTILIDGLTRRIATAEDEFDSLPLDKAGKLLVALQRSTVYKERMKSTRSRACKDVESNIMRRLRDQIQSDPELLNRLSIIVSDAAAEEARKDEQ